MSRCAQGAVVANIDAVVWSTRDTRYEATGVSGSVVEYWLGRFVSGFEVTGVGSWRRHGREAIESEQGRDCRLGLHSSEIPGLDGDNGRSRNGEALHVGWILVPQDCGLQL